MIKYMSISNFFSINEEVALELDLGKKKQTETNNVIMLYGANGSGKSTIIKVFDLLNELFIHSFANSRGFVKFPYMQHIASDTKITKIYIEYIRDTVVYKYSIELDEYKIYSEKLETSRGKVILHREGNQVLKSPKLQKTLQNNLIDNVSIIALAKIFKELNRFSKSFIGINPYNNEKDTKEDINMYNKVLSNIINIEYCNLKQEVLKLLEIADVEIVDYRIVYKDDKIVDTFFVHKFGNGTKEINYKYESTGTIKLFNLAFWLLFGFDEFEKTIIIDEIDTHLHFSMVEYVINRFKNNTKTQLICTAHNPMYISMLDKHSVWLTQKQDGATKVYSAGDFDDIDDDMDLAKLYEIGRLGAVPRKLYGQDDE